MQPAARSVPRNVFQNHCSAFGPQRPCRQLGSRMRDCSATKVARTRMRHEVKAKLTTSAAQNWKLPLHGQFL